MTKGPGNQSPEEEEDGEESTILPKMRERTYKRKGYPKATRPMPENCELCGKPPHGRFGLSLDHDHTTGEFRGWLCSDCNLGIGKLGDNIKGIIAALEYLKRTEKQLSES